MITEPSAQSHQHTAASDFDANMAQLMVLITHHSLTGCTRALQPILERLEMLFAQAELDFFPEQREVLIKMHKLWLLEQAKGKHKH